MTVQPRSSLRAVLLLFLSFPVPLLAQLELLQYALVEIVNFVKIRTIGPSCKTLPSIPDFDFNRYIAKSWYVQKQQISEQRDYSERFCMVETYSTENQTSPDKALMIKFHTGQGGGGVNVNPFTDSGYCMTKFGDQGGQFRVSFCFLPSFLTFLGGPWHVVDTDYDSYSIVTAGQLTLRGECDDFSGLCTVPSRGELLDPGSWLGQRQGIYFMTRNVTASATLIEMMEEKAIAMGICTAAILPVENEGCNFQGAVIK